MTSVKGYYAQYIGATRSKLLDEIQGNLILHCNDIVILGNRVPYKLE